MSRIRSVHPGLWTDETFATLGTKTQLLLLALGTFSDYADMFPWDVPAIERHAGRGDIEDALLEIVNAGLIARYGDYGEILFAFGFRRRRVSKWEAIRSFVFRRDGQSCRYCGSGRMPLHCDHVVPVSRGGNSHPDNLATACEPCNLSKGSRLLSEWGRQ
jgi:hypothetical protein